MTRDLQDQLRPKDQAVLQAVRDGDTDVQRITEATTLENHEVNYCFTKLQQLGLIDIEKRDGYVTRVVNGQERTFQTPKKAHLTDLGRELELHNGEEIDHYEDLTHGELVEKVYQLESEIEQLRLTFESFQKQVKDEIFD
jgi:predicted transcriptional regulator